MIYSAALPAYVSPECYKDIDIALEVWYNSENNPFRHLFESCKRVPHKYITEKLALVIEDYYDNEDMLLVKLVSKENDNYVPFKQVFHKNFGELE